MPSKSAKQHRFMEMVAHNPKMAKKVGVPQSVGKDFEAADKGKKFSAGGVNMINRDVTRHGRVLGAAKGVPAAELTKYIGKKEGGKIMAKAEMKESKSESKKEMAMDKKQDVAMIKKAFKEHDAQEHKGGKGTKIALKKGGMAMKKMASGGKAESMGPRNMSKDVEAGSNKHRKFGQSDVQKRGLTKGKNLGDSGKTISPKTIKMAKGGKVKRYDDGGDVEIDAPVQTQTAQGQNANIGDDTRARAMAALASGNMDQQVPTPTKPRMKSRPKSNVMTKAMGNMNPMGDTYKKGGDVKKMARGGGIEQRGKTRGRFC
jgi:hypothetical protein